MAEPIDSQALFYLWTLAAFALSGGLGFFMGRIFGEATKTKTVVREKIPTELKRLAKVLRIKEDVPETQSYGRMIHDLFEEKDQEILALKGELEDATDRASADYVKLRAEIADLHERLADEKTQQPSKTESSFKKGTQVTLRIRKDTVNVWHDVVRGFRSTTELSKKDITLLANLPERPKGHLGDGKRGVWVSPHTRRIFMVNPYGGQREIGIANSTWTPGFYPHGKGAFADTFGIFKAELQGGREWTVTEPCGQKHRVL